MSLPEDSVASTRSTESQNLLQWSTKDTKALSTPAGTVDMADIILFSSVLLYLIWISPLEKIRKTLLYQRDDILLYGGYGLILVELERLLTQGINSKSPMLRSSFDLPNHLALQSYFFKAITSLAYDARGAEAILSHLEMIGGGDFRKAMQGVCFSRLRSRREANASSA
ncbi:hypothetical protein DM860_000219 [Cuscuta australis]|uniref:Uncharacterized protein n=1 Tax=Cuscuta australis TaxID=267555 RepID=A0A328CW27_9ASTE|nr:hypothetical protein DM860_000219 [Cuscuta australis]